VWSVVVTDGSRRFAAPLQRLLIYTLVLFLAIGLATWIALHGPWLGLQMSPLGEQGVKVDRVHEESPLLGRLEEGDILHGVLVNGSVLSLSEYDHLSQPHAMPTFQKYHDYLDREDRVASALQTSPVTLLTDTNSRVQVEPLSARPLDSLPVIFWLLHFYGALACLIGLSVWVFRPDLLAARLLALSGVGMFAATWLHSLWEARELALSARVFDFLMRGNHMALSVLLGALMVLLVIYPQRLRYSGWIIGCLVAGIFLLQLNENLQLLELPLHSFYLPLLAYYLVGVTLAILQWRGASDSPEDRAALRWVYLSILLAMGMGTLVYILPVAFDIPPLAGPSTMVGLAVTLYIGFALGILRYRLFQLERWWFVAWAWFLGGLAVVLVDLAVVTAFGFNHAYGLGLSVLLVGWVYFPIRQWLWQHLAASAEVSMERHLPEFVEALYISPEEQVPVLWRQLLKQVFQPLALEPVDNTIKDARLADNGVRLLVPVLGEEGGGLSLLYGQKGRRLLGRRDCKIAQALSMTAMRINAARRASEEGARKERQRIMRDLHDDVGGRLLTLIHTAPDNHYEGLARAAMESLRESIHALDDKRRFYLDDLIEGWQEDARLRLLPTGVKMDWQSLPDDAQQIAMTPRYYINLRRVLDEALTNALKHGAACRFIFNASLEKHQLRLQLSNTLPETNRSHWHDGLHGRGLSNMQTRMQELGGELCLYCLTGKTRQFFLEIHLETHLLKTTSASQ